MESGLIAQEIYYDAPELRHLVNSPSNVDPYIATSLDPKVDPDYSSWGSNIAGVNYVGLIPYLIKGIQELSTENSTLKTENANIKAFLSSKYSDFSL